MGSTQNLKGSIVTQSMLQQLKERKGILKFNTTALFHSLHERGLVNQADYVQSRLDRRSAQRSFSPEELKVIHALLSKELKEISALLKQ